LIGHYIAGGPLVLSKGLIARNRCASALREQVFSALQLNCSQRLCSLAPLQSTLGLLYGCLVFAFLDVIEVIAFLDRVALLEENLFKVAFYSGLHLNATNGVDPADKIARLGDLLPLRIHSADWRCFLLCVSGQNAQPYQERNCANTGTQAEKPVSAAATQWRNMFPRSHYSILST
jgi:hypothetical protein